MPKEITHNISVSALYGENLQSLKKMIEHNLHGRTINCPEGAIALTARQRQALRDSCRSLSSVIVMLSDDQPVQMELLALELRTALDNLGSISGQIVTDDVLARIFSKFCIGK